MNSEAIPSSLPSSSSVSTEETHPLSLPIFLTSSASSLKPLRERNRTNLKRRINLSRSQVLSNDFENEDNLSTTKTIEKITTNSQPPPPLPSTPTIHSYNELYSKTVSPNTPSPIHTTVTCSQVWERLASNEEHQNSTSPKSVIPPTASISVLPTHISFTYDPSDDEDNDNEEENLSTNNFQHLPVSSQSKFVQFQFLTFARQQHLDLNDDENKNNNEETDTDDEDDDDNDDEEIMVGDIIQDYEHDEQENQTSKKRKRSVSATDSLDASLSTHDNNAASSSTTKPPCTKKPKFKDPNANFQRLNMRKKQFSHAKKHQFAKGKRNAFYRRMRNAGGSK
ncbi:unnamed protein product [Adineta steineri]|uniref:Uncharacterized protein n=1 Tax=Adineta steineri TaxID=433720 RepID=A0A815DMP3_9BILA|nr:unnamed protein product [Adineta steineri]CAF3606480.1 unnamed protein product [Adineta steineri]